MNQSRFNNTFYNEHDNRQQLNYLDMIKQPPLSQMPLNYNTAAYLNHSIIPTQSLRFNEHGTQKQQQHQNNYRSNKNENSPPPHNSQQYLDHHSFSDLSIKQLTNTRGKKAQRSPCHVELKSQMSPYYYNRSAERFSYIDDQQQLQQQYRYQNPQKAYHCESNIRSTQNYPNNIYYDSIAMNNDDDRIYSSRLQLGLLQNQNIHQNIQHLDYLNNRIHSRIQDTTDNNSMKQPDNNNNSNNSNSNPNFNRSNLQSNYPANVNSNSNRNGSVMRGLTSPIGYDRARSQNGGQHQPPIREEDSFGNQRLEHNYSKNSPLNSTSASTSSISPASLVTDQNLTNSTKFDPDLIQFSSEARRARRNQNAVHTFMSKINVSTVVFCVLLAYVIAKYAAKWISVDTSPVPEKKTIFEQTQSPSNNEEEIRYENLIYSNEKRQGESEQNRNGALEFQSDLEGALEQEKHTNSKIAKKFAIELIQELHLLLKQKGKLYRQEFEDILSNRFMNSMLREILPEVNKQLLNSKVIRIEYDVSRRCEYYSLFPEIN